MIRVGLILLFVSAGLLPSLAADEDLLFRLKGEWNNESGINIQIKLDQLGGWTVVTDDGEGQISQDGTQGGNVRVSTEHRTCYYRATLLVDGRSNWRLVDGPPECLNGYFVPVEHRVVRTAPRFVWMRSNCVGYDVYLSAMEEDGSYTKPVKFLEIGSRRFSRAMAPQSGVIFLKTGVSDVYALVADADLNVVIGGHYNDRDDRTLTVVNDNFNKHQQTKALRFKLLTMKQATFKGADAWALDVKCPEASNVRDVWISNQCAKPGGDILIVYQKQDGTLSNPQGMNDYHVVQEQNYYRPLYAGNFNGGQAKTTMVLTAAPFVYIAVIDHMSGDLIWGGSTSAGDRTFTIEYTVYVSLDHTSTYRTISRVHSFRKIPLDKATFALDQPIAPETAAWALDFQCP